MSLVKSIATIGGLTLVSRILGLVRDKLIAYFLGAGWLADAFVVAFKLPNFLRRLFAEGAFSAAFVPIYTEYRTKEGEEAARNFASEAFAALLLVLIILTSLFELTMPWIIRVMASGFSDDPEKFNLTVHLSRITFPYLLLISLVALYGGILNSMHKFAAAAASPILMNICLIASMIFFSEITETPAHSLSWGVMAAGVVQCIWMAYNCHRTGALPALVRPRFSPEVKQLLTRAAPVAFGAGIAQINLLIDVMIATNIPDAVSYLYFADRINELPLGVIGIAIGTALLPLLSGHIAAGRDAESRNTLNRALELAMLFSLPAAIALIAIGHVIVSVIFIGGAFDEIQAIAVSAALTAYAMGLPAFVTTKVFAPGFFANKDTVTPVKIGVLCMGVNLTLNLLLMGPFGHVGLAIATSIAGWLNIILMGYVLMKRGIFAPDLRLIQRLPRLLISALVMGLMLFGVHQLWGHNLMQESIIIRLLLLGAYVTLGAASFFAIAMVTRAADLSEVKQYLKKRKS